MARDVDGNYYYDEGTVNEQFDNVEVVEDSDGNLSITVNDNEMRVHEFAHLFGGQRSVPTEPELAAGEVMMYVSDGTGAGAAGDFMLARNDGSSINEVILATAGTDY